MTERQRETLPTEAHATLLLPHTVASHFDGQQELSLQRRHAYQYLVTMQGQGHISTQFLVCFFQFPP